MIEVGKISQEEWEEWVQHPTTKSLRVVLRLWQEGLKDRWARGEFTDQQQFATAMLNAKAIGEFEALERVLGLDQQQLAAELDDERNVYEPVGTGPSGTSDPGDAL